MRTVELKDILIHQIEAIEDRSFLAALKKILDVKSESMVYQTSDEQKMMVQEGLAQFQSGVVSSNEDVEKEIDQWLEER